MFKITYLKKSQISVRKTNFFLGKLYQKIFLSQSLPTLGILHTKFGLIWTTSWPDKKDLYLKIANPISRYFPYEKLTFFLGKLYQKFLFSYALLTMGILHIQCGSIWTTLWTNQKDLFFKIIQS